MKVMYFVLALMAFTNIGRVKCYQFLDEIDFAAIREDPDKLRIYMDCVLEEKECTTQYLQIREHLPEIIRTCCAFCSEPQKKELLVMQKLALESHPEKVLEILQKFDPDGDYRKICADKLRMKGIDLKAYLEEES